MWHVNDANMIAADQYYDRSSDEDLAQQILDDMTDSEILEIVDILDIDVEDQKGGYTDDGLEDIFQYIVDNIDTYMQEEF